MAASGRRRRKAKATVARDADLRRQTALVQVERALTTRRDTVFIFDVRRLYIFSTTSYGLLGDIGCGFMATRGFYFTV